MEKPNFVVPKPEPTKERGVFNKIKKVLRAGAIVAMYQLPAPAQAQYVDPVADAYTSWSDDSSSSYDSTHITNYSDYNSSGYPDISYGKAPDSYGETEQEAEKQQKIEYVLKTINNAIKEITPSGQPRHNSPELQEALQKYVEELKKILEMSYQNIEPIKENTETKLP